MLMIFANGTHGQSLGMASQRKNSGKQWVDILVGWVWVPGLLLTSPVITVLPSCLFTGGHTRGYLWPKVG